MDMNIVVIGGMITGRGIKKGDYKDKTGGSGKFLAFSIFHRGYNDSFFIDCIAYNKVAENIEKYIIAKEDIILRGRMNKILNFKDEEQINLTVEEFFVCKKKPKEDNKIDNPKEEPEENIKKLNKSIFDNMIKKIQDLKKNK